MDINQLRKKFNRNSVKVQEYRYLETFKKLNSINSMKTFSMNTQRYIDKQKYEGCLMLEVKDLPELDKLRQQIDVNDVYEPYNTMYGIETDPHITIVYGLRNDIKLTSEVLNKLPKEWNLTINTLSLFENKDYDVLKLDVFDNARSQLHDLRKSILRFPNKQTYDGYNPHITLAYLKKGTGSKYIKEIPSIRLIADGYRYSINYNTIGSIDF